MQVKDIPDRPILEFLASLPPPRWGSWFTEYENSVQNAMPELPSNKLALAKMRNLIRKRLVKGCGCGCRGDFEITDEGRQLLIGDGNGRA